MHSSSARPAWRCPTPHRTCGPPIVGCDQRPHSIRISLVGTPALDIGQVFNLIDWQALTGISGNFDTGSSAIYAAGSNITAGDLDLPALSAGLAWDVSAFTQYGVIVIVPEPSRALFLLLGLLSLMLRRRRR